jgi:hypothetical protein
MIRPEFWEDSKIAKLSDKAKLLYIALWNFADDYGLLQNDAEREEKLRERIWELEWYLSRTTQKVLEDLENERKVKAELRDGRQEAREEIRKLDRELEDLQEADGSQTMEKEEI